MPWMSAPIFTSMRARSCTCGSQAALPMTVVPGVSAAAISAFSVAITEGSSMNTSVGRRPSRRAQHDLAAALGARAHRAERVEVRVEPPAADHIAAGRRHHGAVKARQQRPGEQERGADLLGQLGFDLDLVDRRRTARPRWARARPPRRRSPRGSRSIASTSRIRGTLRTTHLVVGEDRGREDRQGAVLVPGRDHRAGQRYAAFDDELLHGLNAPLAGPGRAARGAFAKRNSHLQRCSPPVADRPA